MALVKAERQGRINGDLPHAILDCVFGGGEMDDTDHVFPVQAEMSSFSHSSSLPSAPSKCDLQMKNFIRRGIA